MILITSFFVQKQDMTMKKNIFLLFLITNALSIKNLSSYPCGFSSDDKRPFFE